jgi:hypothetical protein
LTITIKNKNTNSLEAKLSVGFGFRILNFEDLPPGDDQKPTIPPPLDLMLQDIAISTARGIMYSEFRGTHLHNAILPIVLPSSLKRSKEKKEESGI